MEKARWQIVRLRDTQKLEVIYWNPVTGRKCAVIALSAAVPDYLVADWILGYGHPTEGDVIELSDGTELHFTRFFGHGPGGVLVSQRSRGRLVLKEVKLGDRGVVSIPQRGRLHA